MLQYRKYKTNDIKVTYSEPRSLCSHDLGTAKATQGPRKVKNMSTITKPTYLNNNRCGGIRIDSQNANALQSPLNYHLILLFRFS
jgi:hypothetical protein